MHSLRSSWLQLWATCQMRSHAMLRMVEEDEDGEEDKEEDMTNDEEY